MTMTPEEAALCLRDDPTFATSSPADREAEAILLLGDDDPLAVALAIELALEAAPPPTAIMGPGDEGCRLEKPCAAPNLAGNGRCLDCGAQRGAAAPAEPPQEPAPKPKPLPAPKALKPDDSGSVPALRRGVKLDPGQSFTGRFQEATGMTDKEIAAMLHKSRVTVQAYRGGRLPEKLTVEDVQGMCAAIADQLIVLADLKRDLHASIGEVD